MQVSVVLCTYDPALLDATTKAIESLLNQTYDDREIVVIVDGSRGLYEKIVARFGDQPDVVLHCNEENRGLSESRNVGIELASGDVVAFIDDDAIARPEWLEELVDTFERHDADAAGGRMAPRWVAGKPSFLPEEFYWLIGVAHRGYPEEESQVRNTFGSNIAFRMDALDDVGGFNPALGRFGDRQIQGEETEIAIRLYEERGSRVWYNPDAVVEHVIFEHRIQPWWLLRRAFWQGFSKYAMQVVLDGNGAEAENEFLADLISRYIPKRIWNLIRSPSVERLSQFMWLFLLTGGVGFGYLYAAITALLNDHHVQPSRPK